jgi:hypothetical protein
MFEFIGVFGRRGRRKPKVSVFGVSRRPTNRVRYILRAGSDDVRRRAVARENERPR